MLSKMKQHTTPEQTAKLIELGFEKPRIDAGVTKWEGYEPICTGSYTLGELIEMLPKSIKVNDCYFTLTISAEFDNWLVEYVDIAFGSQAYVRDVELIDALFTEIVKLKEEGVI